MVKRFFKRLLGLVIGLLLLVGLWLVGGVWWPLAVPQPNAQLAQLLLEDVELIDVESGLLWSGQDILIEAGHIVAVGPDLQAPGAKRIAGDGLFAIPGPLPIPQGDLELDSGGITEKPCRIFSLNSGPLI